MLISLHGETVEGYAFLYAREITFHVSLIDDFGKPAEAYW